MLPPPQLPLPSPPLLLPLRLQAFLASEAAAELSSQLGLNNARRLKRGQYRGAHDAPELVVQAARGQEVGVGRAIVQLQGVWRGAGRMHESW